MVTRRTINILLRVADSRTTNRTSLVGFFIVDGDCQGRLVRIILVKRKIGKNVIKIFLCKTYYIDKVSSPFADDVCSLGRHFDIYIPRLSVRGLHLFTMVFK